MLFKVINKSIVVEGHVFMSPAEIYFGTPIQENNIQEKPNLLQIQHRLLPHNIILESGSHDSSRKKGILQRILAYGQGKAVRSLAVRSSRQPVLHCGIGKEVWSIHRQGDCQADILR
jgi:hypothetical protein